MAMTPITITLELPAEAGLTTAAGVLALIHRELPSAKVTIGPQSVTLRPDPRRTLSSL